MNWNEKTTNTKEKDNNKNPAVQTGFFYGFH